MASKQHATSGISISLPNSVITAIDQLVDKRFSSRSATLTRIYLEWVDLKRWELPPLVKDGVDRLANKGQISRSEALTRIYLEWVGFQEGGQNVSSVDQRTATEAAFDGK